MVFKQVNGESSQSTSEALIHAAVDLLGMHTPDAHYPVESVALAPASPIRSAVEAACVEAAAFLRRQFLAAK